MHSSRFFVITAFMLITVISICLFLFNKEQKSQSINQGQQKQKLNETSESTPDISEKDEALKNALNLYGSKKAQGLDMASGPCLGQISQDWVLDIAHNPRASLDDKAENQCEEYKSGKVHHFIELDPEGKLIGIN